MQVQVEHRTDHLGLEMPVRFRFDGREIEIIEIIDQWYGPDYCYFKIEGSAVDQQRDIVGIRANGDIRKRIRGQIIGPAGAGTSECYCQKTKQWSAMDRRRAPDSNPGIVFLGEEIRPPARQLDGRPCDACHFQVI